MALVAAQLQAVVSVQGADTAKSQLSDVGKTAESTGGGFKNILGGALGFVGGAFSTVAGIAGPAIGFVKDQLTSSIQVAMAHQDVMAQTTAAIKSTGDASGLSAQQIENLGISLSKVTPFSDDVIQSGENMLLTFTHIGKDVFPTTTQTMLDMAQAMHIGPTQAAMQLGKALDDPAKGLTALTREGVKFSDQEKEQIKTMMAHNNIAGAQKVMLKELQTEFGGSAKAAGQTFGGQLQILKNILEDTKQKIGGALLPVLQGFTGFLTGTAASAFEKIGHYLSLFDLTPITYAWKQFTGAVKELLAPLNTSSDMMGMLSPHLTDMRNLFSQFLVSGIRDIAGIITNIANAVKGFAENINVENISSFSDGFKQLGSVLSPLTNALKGELGKELKDLGQDAQQVGQWFMSSVVPAFKQALPGFLELGKTILDKVIPAFIQIRGVVVDVLQHAFQVFAPIIEKMVPPLIKFAGVLANDISNGLKFIMPYVLQAAHAIGDFAKGLIDRVAPIVTQVFGFITQAVQFFWSMWMVVWPGVSQILKGVWDEIVGIIKIAWSIVTGIINIGLDLISGNWGQAWNDMLNMFGGIWDGMKSMLSGAWGIMKGLFTTIVDEIIGFFTFLWDKLTGHSIIPDMINDIVSWFGQLPGRAMAFIHDLISNMTTTLGGLGSKALTWAQDMINQFVQGILSGVGAVGNAVSKIADKISSFLHFSKPDVGPLVNVDNWMPDFGDLLSKGLANQVSKVQAPALQLASTMAMSISPLQGGLTALPAGARAIPSSIVSQSSASRSGEIHVHNYIDGKEITNNVGPRIIKTTRTSGPIRSNV